MITEGKKILVVDDDPDIREIIIYVLEAEGYQVSGLNNGLSVVETIVQIQPNMLLLDVQLGDSDGRDICRELKSQDATKEIPVIMISASHSWKGILEKQCNADDYLPKPFDITDLLAHVRRYAA